MSISIYLITFFSEFVWYTRDYNEEWNALFIEIVCINVCDDEKLMIDNINNQFSDLGWNPWFGWLYKILVLIDILIGVAIYHASAFC